MKQLLKSTARLLVERRHTIVQVAAFAAAFFDSFEPRSLPPPQRLTAERKRKR